MVAINAYSTAQAVKKRLRTDARKHPAILAEALSGVAFEGRRDLQKSMVTDLDRPTRFSQNALNYQKATTRTLTSSVLVNKSNGYLHFMVFGGVRTASQRGRVLVPAKQLRTNRHGNLSKARRRRFVSSPSTFSIRKGRKQVLMNRSGRKVTLVGALEQETKYDATGYWDFFGHGLKAFDRHFNRKYIRAFNKRIR